MRSSPFGAPPRWAAQRGKLGGLGGLAAEEAQAQVRPTQPGPLEYPTIGRGRAN
ncbi:hypothetical protein ACQP25_19950 [Microtetraspora malaysiensis]|uniref:hypothetical protein n=1 Tax=Microtetraspora malaysiensis TaxID=161358 RepID=UPI003D9161DB